MNRCGECDVCISGELAYMAEMEFALHLRSHGDITKYLNLMGAWMDMFVAEGIK